MDEAFVGHELVYAHEVLKPENVRPGQKAEIISSFISTQFNKQLLDKLPQLKFIATRSTGFDHIDLEECQKRGIQVANVPSYGENTVAEFTFGLMLDLLRKITLAYDRLRTTGSFSLEGLRGVDLKGLTLGVVGTGRIGRHVIRIAKGFEMNILACDVHPDQEFAQQFGFTYKELDAVLAEADVVTLHVPYMPSTHHLLNEERIWKMKKGAYLINTSRGGVVETNTLFRALADGRLSGAALDVLEEEGSIKEERQLVSHGHPKQETLKTLLANHVLIDMENVIITPHNAFNTHGALKRILDTTIENIQSFIKGEPKNLVRK